MFGIKYIAQEKIEKKLKRKEYDSLENPWDDFHWQRKSS